jgi:hypothetical protein
MDRIVREALNDYSDDKGKDSKQKFEDVKN